MSLYKTYATDKSAEKQGITLRYPGDEDGVFIELQIARAGGANKKFSTAFTKKFGPYMKTISNMDPTLANRMLAEVYAEAVVLGWKNVTDRDGNPLEFTFDNVVKVFTDLPDFFADVQNQAGNMGLFREHLSEEAREAVSGN